MERRIRIRHLNLGSCNGCDIELLSALRQYSKLQLVTNVEQADLLLVTGGLTEGNASRVDPAEFTRELPIVWLGACASTQGVFAPAACALPMHLKMQHEENSVSVYGCPPPPDAILGALLNLIGKEI